MAPRTRTPLLVMVFATLLAAGVAGAVGWVHHQRVIDQANAERLRQEIEKDEVARARDQRIDRCAEIARSVLEVMPLPDFWPVSKYLWQVKQFTVAAEKKWTQAQLRADLKAGLAEAAAAAPQAGAQAQHRWEQAGDIAFALLDLAGAGADYHHALELADRANRREDSLHLNEKIADVLHAGGRSEEERSLREIVATLRQNSGFVDPAPLMTATRLALCYRDLNRIPEAIALLDDAIKKAPVRAGADPQDMLVLLSVRSFLYRQSSQIRQCEEDVRRVLAEAERIYGPKDSHVAIAAARLAIFLQSVRRPDEAGTVAARAQELCEKNFGPTHPLTVAVLRAAANLRIDAGDFKTAEQSMRKILKIDQENLLPDHPDIASDLMTLGNLAARTNRPAEAQQLLRKALGVFENAFGKNAAETALCRSYLEAIDSEVAHPGNGGTPRDTTGAVQNPSPAGGAESRAQTLATEAASLANSGRSKEAEEKYREALAVAEKQANEDVPGLAAALRHLGGFLYSVKRYEEAEPLLVRALSLEEKKLGPKHPDLVPTLNALAELLIAEGRPTEGEHMLRRAISLGVEHNGVRDPEVTRAMETLGLYLQATKRFTEALVIQREIVKSVELSVGKEHEAYAQALNNVATTLMASEQYDEAERTFQQVIAIGDKLPPDTPALADWLNNYAVLCMKRHHGAQADFLYQRALGILFRASSRNGTDPPHLQGTIASYTMFLKSAGLDPLTAEDRVERIRRGEELPALWK